MATQHHYRYRIYNVCVCRQVCECRNVNFLLIIIIPFLSPVRVGGDSDVVLPCLDETPPMHTVRGRKGRGTIALSVYHVPVCYLHLSVPALCSYLGTFSLISNI